MVIIVPYIVKKLETQEIEVGNRKTLILDVEKTMELTEEMSLNGELGKGLTYKEAIQIKNNFGDLTLFKDLVNKSDSKWISIIRQIENIDEFYNIVWEKTILELMFMSQYYISLISKLESFEQVIKGGAEFDYWFLNSVKYNMLEKIKDFYLKTTQIYANKVSIDVYETDIEIKVKEILDEIENNHLLQVRDLLKTTWNNTMSKFKEWEAVQNKKRRTIIFD